MQTLQHSYRGLSLVLSLNSDRLYSLAVILLALCTGAYIGSL